MGTEGWVGVISGVIASGSGANAEYATEDPIARTIAKPETKTARRLSFFLRKALLASKSCLAANLASLSRSKVFPIGDFVKAVQLSCVLGSLESLQSFSIAFEYPCGYERITVFRGSATGCQDAT
jgi:hypothetical protein